MQEGGFSQVRILTTASLVLAALLLAGCSKSQSASRGGKAKPGAAAGAKHGFNMFEGTPLADHPPDALDINRDGTRLIAKQFVPGGPATLVISLPLSEDGFGEPTVMLQTDDVIRSFVRAHPTDDACLLITNEQLSGGPVVDVIWKHRNGQKDLVPYDKAVGYPKVLPPEACYGLEPIYSWDGSQIVVPLHTAGLCVMDAVTNKGRFVPYPKLPGEPTGMALGALPPKDGRNLIYVSLWNKIKGPEQWCHLSLLDLDSGEWRLPVDLDWLVYQVAGDDPLNQAWQVRGSRSPDKASEHKYVPRLALLDPRSGVVDLQMFYGTPYWPVKLDPRGRFAVYLDQQLKAIARLELDSEQLDLDKRFYADDAQLFVAPGGDPVYVWSKGTLVRATYSEHKDFGE